MANKKYVGPEVAEAIAGAVSTCDKKIKDSSSKVWELYPGNIDEVTSESPSGAITMMSFPTPADLLEHIAEIKEGDVIDITKLLGYDNQDGEYFRLQVTSTNLEITGDTPNRYVAMASTIQGGMALSAIIDVETCGIVMVTLADTSTVDASLGGSGWSSGPIPNWGDADSYWTINDMQQLQLGKRFHSALTPSGVSSSATGDPVKDASGNYVDGIVVGKGKTENSEYCVVLGAAKFKTDNNAGTMTAPGIFYVTQKNKNLSTTPGKVRFYPLLNMWKEINDVQKKITELEPKKWNIGPSANETINVSEWHRCTDGVVAYAYSLPTSVAENLNSMSKGDLLVLGGLPTEFINGKEIPIDEIDGDGIRAIANGRWYFIDVQINSSGVFVDFLNKDPRLLNDSIRRNKRHLRKHGHELTARPIRVLTGRLPKMGDEGNRNYYLYSNVHWGKSEPTHICVNLWTRKLKKWLKSTDVDDTTFEIAGVGFVSARFTHSGELTEDRYDEWMSAMGLTMEVSPEKITITKPAGKNCIDFVGLVAEMEVKKLFDVRKGRSFGFSPYIVRYDKRKGWMAFQQTSGFALDKLSPITPNELFLYFQGCGDSKKIEVQFRTRALKDKSLDANDPCNPRYNFWSQTKRRGWVCRARRTRGQLYNGKSHGGNKVRSHAYRKVGASDWVYFSLRWGLRDAYGNRKIESVRQLS